MTVTEGKGSELNAEAELPVFCWQFEEPGEEPGGESASQQKDAQCTLCSKDSLPHSLQSKLEFEELSDQFFAVCSEQHIPEQYCLCSEA